MLSNRVDLQLFAMEPQHFLRGTNCIIKYYLHDFQPRRLYHGSDDQLLASHCRGLASISCPYMWNFSGRSGTGPGFSLSTLVLLDGPGIESRWGRDFPHLSRPALRPIQYNGYRVFPGVRCGRGVTLTPHPLLMPRSKIEYSYNSTLPKGLCGLWKGWNLPTYFSYALSISLHYCSIPIIYMLPFPEGHMGKAREPSIHNAVSGT
jgi:hypothetical protein